SRISSVPHRSLTPVWALCSRKGGISPLGGTFDAEAQPVTARAAATTRILNCRPFTSTPSFHPSVVDGRHPMIDELLHPLGRVDLGRVEMPLGIDGDVMHPVELPGVAPVAAEARQHSPAVPLEQPHVVVLPVGAVELRLAAIDREVEIPH